MQVRDALVALLFVAGNTARGGAHLLEVGIFGQCSVA